MEHKTQPSSLIFSTRCAITGPLSNVLTRFSIEKGRNLEQIQVFIP